MSRVLTDKEKEYLLRFSETRRMMRKPADLQARYGGEHGLDGEYGTQGEFFAFDDGDCGQNETTGVIDYNKPPSTQPGLWCQWIPTEEGDGLEWNGGEKFYHYIEWLEYIIKSFMVRWGIVVNGYVKWIGEDKFNDQGTIHVVNNVVTTS